MLISMRSQQNCILGSLFDKQLSLTRADTDIFNFCLTIVKKTTKLDTKLSLAVTRVSLSIILKSCDGNF